MSVISSPTRRGLLTLAATAGTISLLPTGLRAATKDGAEHLMIVDLERNEVVSGEQGELVMRGPQIMQGYWGRPDETKAVLTADGWLRTGDIGVFDTQGYLKLLDRKKDLIIVSGFKVFPNEVEDVAMLHPGVREAAVIGVPDARTGEAVKLFVIKRDPALTEADLADFLHARLVNYKRPHIIEFRDDLPKSNIGKILRKELH